MDRAFGHPAKPEERTAGPLAGGIVRNGYQCGMVWGSALAAGAEAYRRLGAGHRAETGSLIAARRVDVADHPRHLRGGGCARILDALSSGRQA